MLLRLLALGKELLHPRRHAGDAPQSAESPWPALRSQPGAADAGLTPETLVWLDSLPAYAHPKQLCERHPRVLNRLAGVWGDRSACTETIESLLADDRDGRTGFSPTIRSEFVRLQFLHQKLMVHGDRAPARPAPSPSPSPQAQQPAIDAAAADSRRSRV